MHLNGLTAHYFCVTYRLAQAAAIALTLVSYVGADEVIDVPIFPVVIAETVHLKAVDAPDTPSEEASYLYRKAKLDTWKILGERNIDRAFDRMLQNRPNNQSNRVAGWIDFMQGKYDGPLRDTLRARQIGRTSPIPSELDSEGELSLLPVNGCIILEEVLCDYVAHEMSIEGAESVVVNLPLVISIIEDWCQSEDAPVFGVKNFERMLNAIVTNPECPDLADALWTVQSPYRVLGDYKLNHPSQWQCRLHLKPDEMDKILDSSVNDTEVESQCQKLLGTFFALMSEEPVPDSERFNNSEAWMSSFEREIEVNRKFLSDESIDLKQSASSARLGVAAAYLHHRKAAEEFRSYFRAPLVDAIRHNKRSTEEKLASNQTSNPRTSSMIASQLFGYWQPRPEQYWFSSQSIAATSLLFHIRRYYTTEQGLPDKLKALQLKLPAYYLDPISGVEWEYERVSATEAKLSLMDTNGEPRQTWLLVATPN